MRAKVLTRYQVEVYAAPKGEYIVTYSPHQYIAVYNARLAFKLAKITGYVEAGRRAYDAEQLVVRQGTANELYVFFRAAINYYKIKKE